MTPLDRAVANTGVVAWMAAAIVFNVNACPRQRVAVMLAWAMEKARPANARLDLRAIIERK